MTSPELAADGFEEDCRGCQLAIRRGHEACPEHYIPTHERLDPEECPTCGGRKDPEEDQCGRCEAASV